MYYCYLYKNWIIIILIIIFEYFQIDNQEIIAPIQPAMIEAVLDTGVDWNSVMQVIQRKLIETGSRLLEQRDASH